MTWPDQAFFGYLVGDRTPLHNANTPAFALLARSHTAPRARACVPLQRLDYVGPSVTSDPADPGSTASSRISVGLITFKRAIFSARSYA